MSLDLSQGARRLLGSECPPACDLAQIPATGELMLSELDNDARQIEYGNEAMSEC